MRQDRLAGQRPVGAAQRDLDAVVERLLEIGEQGAHFGAGLEAMLRRQAAAVGGADQRAFGDAQQRVLRLVVGGGGEIGLVGGDQRQALRIGELEQRRLDAALALQPVALQLDVEPAVEQRREPLQPRFREFRQAERQRPVDRPRRSAGQRDQALGFGERGEADMRLVAVGRVEPDARGEPHQRAVALFVLGDERQRRARDLRLGEAGGGGRRVAEVDGDLRADDRLHPGLRQLLRKLQRAEQVVGVGDRQRRHRIGFGELGQRLDRQRPLAQRKGAVDAQMDETDGFDERRIHDDSGWRSALCRRGARLVEAARSAGSAESRAQRRRKRERSARARVCGGCARREKKYEFFAGD